MKNNSIDGSTKNIFKYLYPKFSKKLKARRKNKIKIKLFSEPSKIKKHFFWLFIFIVILLYNLSSLLNYWHIQYQYNKINNLLIKEEQKVVDYLRRPI